MTDFVSGEDIEAFCSFCPHRKQRVSKRTGLYYDYCQSFLSPCFKVMELCRAEHESQPVSWRAKTHTRQTTFKLEAEP